MSSKSVKKQEGCWEREGAWYTECIISGNLLYVRRGGTKWKNKRNV